MFARSRQLSFIISLLALLTVAGVPAGVRLQSEMTQEKHAQPGESYRGTLVLHNPGAMPAEAKVYQTDYSFSSDGGSLYGPAGQLPRSNAKWISVARELVVIPPNGTERIDYEVKVPGGKGSGLSGTYWSMIMIEPIADTSRESAADLSQAGTRITQALRYGVQMVTHIGNTGEAGLTFANPRLIKEDGSRIFGIDVTNAGQRSLRSGLSLELYSLSGNPIGKFQGEARRLYPGTSLRFKIDLGEVPNGKYLGLVVADGTGDNLFGANVELDIE